MALSLTSPPSLFSAGNSAVQRRLPPTSSFSRSPFLSSFVSHSRYRFTPLASPKSRPSSGPDKFSADPPADGEPERISGGITDEWGEKAEVEQEDVTSAQPDPPIEEDEWGRDEGPYLSGNGSTGSGFDEGEAAEGYDKNGDLKRCLVDSFYGTEIGLKASTETRAEIVELINQLEAANPTPAPTEAAALLNGNWILLYTAFSELLPLLAAGTLPLVKLKRISQEIDVSSNTIKNSATFTGPLGTFSFSASATFEVRSPSRIQVQFKEGIFPPPELSSSINLPKVDVYGMKVDLTPVERTLKPLEDVVANISRTISGQPPLRVSIPGERTQSWLVTTYLDEDLRISRGDGGLFVLVKEGSPLSAGV